MLLKRLVQTPPKGFLLWALFQLAFLCFRLLHMQLMDATKVSKIQKLFISIFVHLCLLVGLLLIFIGYPTIGFWAAVFFVSCSIILELAELWFFKSYKSNSKSKPPIE
jgi:hypothetical protein